MEKTLPWVMEWVAMQRGRDLGWKGYNVFHRIGPEPAA